MIFNKFLTYIFIINTCFTDELLDRIASDSVVKSYLDKVDVRIGDLMSKLSRKPDVDQEEVKTYGVRFRGSNLAFLGLVQVKWDTDSEQVG